jgi:hypothetical protein
MVNTLVSIITPRQTWPVFITVNALPTAEEDIVSVGKNRNYNYFHKTFVFGIKGESHQNGAFR